tara:strand:+ start:1024 stop:1182 length:159 start_codon:yes stop_codon:yes gene_type:complete
MRILFSARLISGEGNIVREPEKGDSPQREFVGCGKLRKKNLHIGEKPIVPSA